MTHEEVMAMLDSMGIRDLDLLTIGMVNDMFVESHNDEYDYPAVATQEQMDRF